MNSGMLTHPSKGLLNMKKVRKVESAPIDTNAHHNVEHFPQAL